MSEDATPYRTGQPEGPGYVDFAAAGPGKYDELATAARLASGAQGVVLMIFGGNKGPGFSVQARPDLVHALPGLLRTMASLIERERQREGN